MIVTVYPAAGDFLRDAQDVLLRDEAANGLMLGTCLRLQRHPERITSPPYLATVSDAGDVVLAAMMTPPFKLVLCTAAEAITPAAQTLARDLLAGNWAVPGVHAAPAVAEQFAEVWVHLANANYTRGTRERIYELRQVVPPRPAPGGLLRLACAEDAEIATVWADAFLAEALPGEPRQDTRTAVDRRIADQVLWIWDDGRPVSMAATGRSTPNSVAIGLVYTPPELRGRGYASACVAQVSQRMLDSGYRFCTLYTDLANPTSNHIYQAIGYRPVCDINEYLFIPTDSPPTAMANPPQVG